MSQGSMEMKAVGPDPARRLDRVRERGRMLPAAFPVSDVGLRAAVDLFERPVPKGAVALEASLRARIAGGLYLGTLGSGARLPSIRELARRTGLNHKIVRRVYEALERSGWVEVRDRSGIYVAAAAAENAELERLEAWVADVVAQGVQQGLCTGDLSPMLERVLTVGPLRCACVDATEDDRFALCREIADSFGLDTVPVDPTSGGLATRISEADLVVTTPFHAGEVQRALAPGQPLVVASLHPALYQVVRAAPEDQPLRIVCIDGRAGNRLRHALGPRLATRLRVVALNGSVATPEEDLQLPGIATLAAWARLAALEPRPRLGLVPFLSPRTVRRIASLLVRLSREAPAIPSAKPGVRPT